MKDGSLDDVIAVESLGEKKANVQDHKRVERNRIAISLRSRLLHLVVGQFH